MIWQGIFWKHGKSAPETLDRDSFHKKHKNPLFHQKYNTPTLLAEYLLPQKSGHKKKTKCEVKIV
jgi:hypothetical protein